MTLYARLAKSIFLLVLIGGGLVLWQWLKMPDAKMVLSEAEYQAVLMAVPPSSGEDEFADIPWRLSLWEARREAAESGKPILLWEMDGHPLACG